MENRAKCGSLLAYPENQTEETSMAKPNYAFAKRQRDLAKKQKKEEKRLRKAAANPTVAGSLQPPLSGETQVSPDKQNES